MAGTERPVESPLSTSETEEARTGVEILPVFVGPCGECPAFIPHALMEARGICVFLPKRVMHCEGTCEVRRFQTDVFIQTFRKVIKAFGNETHVHATTQIF